MVEIGGGRNDRGWKREEWQWLDVGGIAEIRGERNVQDWSEGIGRCWM